MPIIEESKYRAAISPIMDRNEKKDKGSSIQEILKTQSIHKNQIKQEV
jgi:hypothetical protein